MFRLDGRSRRTVTGVLALVAGFSMFAASPAAAFSILHRAGTACPFDIEVEVLEQAQDGAPGHQISHQVGSGNLTITNLDTGATMLWFSRHTYAETFDPATKTYHAVGDGRTLAQFSTGDIGPNGVVGKSGALYGISGTQKWTVTKNGVITAFSFTGSALDICAELSD